ncbi:UNVERIFIED_CONTAM: multidrug resistance efflux pump [Paenibacillus sp. PvR008]
MMQAVYPKLHWMMPSQQQESLQKLLNGATAEERMQAKEQTTQASVAVKQAAEEIRGAQLSVDRSKTQLETIQQSRQQLADQKLAVDLLQQQKQTQEVQLKTLLLKKERLVLKAPQDGKITAISTKVGENVGQGSPVITLETNKLYYDLYVNEDQVGKFKANKEIKTHISALNKDLQGTVRYVTSAPQFANVKMSREKGEADTATFQVRVGLILDNTNVQSITLIRTAMQEISVSENMGLSFPAIMKTGMNAEQAQGALNGISLEVRSLNCFVKQRFKKKCSK